VGVLDFDLCEATVFLTDVARTSGKLQIDPAGFFAPSTGQVGNRRRLGNGKAKERGKDSGHVESYPDSGESRFFRKGRTAPNDPKP
jgi:hypothetical protein